MARNPLFLKPWLQVVVQSGNGAPYALRVDTRRLALILAFVALIGFVMLVGTLLFFREMEMNRGLTEQVLELETREKLAQSGTAPTPRTVANASATSSATPSASTAPAPPTATASATPAPATETVSPRAAVGARVSELAADCVKQNCGVKVAMTGTTSQPVEGTLLIVLETEIPRIGTGNPSTQVRKRYYLYPGNTTRDELSQPALASIPGKPFKFSRALSTSAAFTIGKLLRPIAVNVYLYDAQRTMIQHERKVIERDEEGTP